MASVNPDSPPSTFEKRVEKIQNSEEVSKFVETFKSGRTDIQVWENYDQGQGSSQGPSTSSMGNNAKIARHHVIPGETLRDAFMYMLSNQETWPWMVQMLNGALENLRHHKSSTKIKSKNIDIAQDALNMFDKRIPDCDFDFDTRPFDEALEYLLAVFYWSPFNVYYGPLPCFRAPADAGNTLDKDMFYGLHIVTTESLKVLEDLFKNSKITEFTVKVYLTNLFQNPTPRLAGSYRKVSLSFDRHLEDCVRYDFVKTSDPEEYNKFLSQIKNDEYIVKGPLKVKGSCLLHATKVKWIYYDLVNAGACEKCRTYAKDSLTKGEDKKYKCKNKKCPFSSPQPKYALHSFVNDNSTEKTKKMFNDLWECYFSSAPNPDNLAHIDPELVKKGTNIIAGDEMFLDALSKPQTALGFIFFTITDNFDYEYNRLKEIEMRNKPVSMSELYVHPLSLKCIAPDDMCGKFLEFFLKLVFKRLEDKIQ